MITDSEYSSEELFDELYKLGIVATGTARANWLKYCSKEMRLEDRQHSQLPKGKMYSLYYVIISFSSCNYL